MSGPDGVDRKRDTTWQGFYEKPLPGEDRRIRENLANAPWAVDVDALAASAPVPHVVFTNPAMRGAPVALAPPPPPPPLPVAPNAFAGVKLKAMAENLPPTTRSDPSRALRCDHYKLVPALVKQSDGSEAVAYYDAVNTKTKHGDFVVGPANVEAFRANASRYETAAANAYMFGEPDEVTRQSMKAVQETLDHGIVAGLRQVVKANQVAWSDPRWVTKKAVETAAGLGAAAAAPEAAPEAEIASTTRARMYRPSAQGTTSLPAGAGATDKYGNVRFSTNGSAADVALARAHESVHSFLSPKAMNGLREFRADVAMSAYDKSALCRYLEEALAESYAQAKVNGLASLPEGIRFPIANGYVTTSRVIAEAAIGTILYGGVLYGVYAAVDGK